jgi:hypothetical protein
VGVDREALACIEQLDEEGRGCAEVVGMLRAEPAFSVGFDRVTKVPAARQARQAVLGHAETGVRGRYPVLGAKCVLYRLASEGPYGVAPPVKLLWLIRPELDRSHWLIP